MIVTDTLFSKLLKSFVAFCAIATLGITASTPAFADQTSKSLDVNLTLGNSISVRILDSTATSDLSLLSFDLTPTASGVTSTKRAIVDVSTSNITGYKLYVEANGKDHNNNYTTDLVQGDTADSHVIPTSTSTSSNKNFWNYVNPATSSATAVPSHGNPDQIGYLLEPTTSTKANVDINVGVDTTITAGSYTNQLLFTAIANPDSIGYTLNFNSNLPSGADPSTLQNFPANQAVSSSATSYTFTIPSTTPTLTGYDLVHYQNANNSTETYSPGDTVTVNADPSSSTMSGSKTLNAIWSNITYDIAFDANEPSGTTATGSTASMTNLDYNTSYNLTTNGYTITGHTFGGWCSVAVTNPVANPATACATASGTYYANGASVQGLTETSGSTVTMYALWTINSNTVTVTAGTGIASTTGSGDYDYGTTVTVGHTESAGYHFTGWTTVSGGVTVDANNQFTMPDNDVSVTANGAINTCPITYNSNAPSGSSASGTTADSSMTYNQIATLTTNGYTVTGYQFDGWATTSGGSVVYTTTIPAADTAAYCTTHNTTKTLYAHWTKKYTYTLNLNTNDGTTNKQILNYPSSGGTTDTSHQFTSLNTYAPTREGYNFLGWATTSTGTTYVTSRTLNSSSAGSTPSADGFPVTDNLYAIWEEKTYTITVNASTGATVSTGQGGPWTSSITLTFKNSDASKTFFVKTDSGYAFDQIGNCGQGYSCSGGTPGQTGTIAIYVAGTSGSMWTGSMTAQVLPTLQNQTAISTCKNAATGTTYNLYDSRDGEKYTVAKLADGKCWMTQNLRLVGPKSLTTSDSDVPSSGFSLTAPDSGTWCTTNSAACDNQSMVLNSGNDSYGTYYNWYAATAGTGKYETSSGSVSNSICPRGWRLPTGGSSGEFQTLYGYYNSAALMMGEPAFVLSGYRYGSSTYDQGSSGYYWSSTAYNSNLAYNLYLDSSDVYPAVNGRKYRGFTVRCVAR